MAKLILVSSFLFLFSTASQAWEHYQNTDPFTDEDRSMVIATSEDGIGELVVRCDFDGMNLLIYMEGMNVADTGIPVMWRFDKGEVVTATNWSASLDNYGAYAPLDIVGGLVDNMMTGTRVFFRVTNNDAISLDFSFTLAGFIAQLNKLTCVPTAGLHI